MSRVAKLFPHHLDDHRPFDFTHPVAEVIQHPINTNMCGLKNLTSEKWVIATADGSTTDVEPGKSVLLASGTRRRFGRVEGGILH